MPTTHPLRDEGYFHGWAVTRNDCCLTCFEPRQQSQRVITADPRKIFCRKAELHNAVSRLSEGDEGIVAPEQNLCGWDETRECRDRWRLLKADVKYRFSIDMASLKSE